MAPNSLGLAADTPHQGHSEDGGRARLGQYAEQTSGTDVRQMLHGLNMLEICEGATPTIGERSSPIGGLPAVAGRAAMITQPNHDHA